MVLLLAQAALLNMNACSEGPFDPPYDATIGSSTEGLTVIYNAAVAEEDGYGLVYHNQAIVKHEDEYGRNLPLENIVVEIYSYWSGTYLLPEKAVTKVDDYLTECSEGNGDEEFQALCDVFLNDADNQYYELTGKFLLASDTGDPATYRPNYLRGVTDNRGIVDFYLFLDSTPGGGTDFGIEMSTSVDQTVLIVSSASTEGK